MNVKFKTIFFWVIIVLLSLGVLASLFYAEEDWRGKRAWENCKRELETKGEVLDWNAYVPPPMVRDDQNFFKAPKMAEWFVKNSQSLTNELAERLRNADTTATITNEIAATKYLIWSDQFQPDFKLIHDALKRPYMRMDGDYSQTFTMPIPNFVTVRAVSQTLAQRAKCYLLLDQPEKALNELTLLNDSRRLLEAAPTGKPMTLVAAMINVAVTGLYTETIANGLQKRAWQEPQLAVIEKQLEQINLIPFVIEAIREERAGHCHFIETDAIAKIKDVKHPNMIRGWFYQNLVTIARLNQEAIDSVDFTNNLILPERANDVQREQNAIEKPGFFRPYTFFAAIAVPSFTKAFQTLARNQTMVNEAQIACALERYHLAHGEYPDTLDMLVPQFIEKLPHDIIGGDSLIYHSTVDGKFLLYSVGWNEKDDGGIESPQNKNGGTDYTRGDWVWKN